MTFPRLAATFAAALTLALPAQAQDKLTLMLDWYVNPDHAPIILAQEQGFFADEGLAVEIIAPADPADESDQPRSIGNPGAPSDPADEYDQPRSSGNLGPRE